MTRLMPEQALSRIITSLRKTLPTESIISIEAGGSVPLGTYIVDPDIDIFIKTHNKFGTMKDLKLYYPRGISKQGELDIWHIPNLFGYPVDFVVLDPDHIKIQSLEHTKYYMDIMTDEFRERIIWLKKFFKDINCYGAEVGGITGICVTRLAELYPTVEKVLHFLITNLIHVDGPFVEDPTLSGRNLFASVLRLKVKLMVAEINNYLMDGKYNKRDLGYFFESYFRVYRVRRRKKIMGTDMEFQFVNSSVIKAWREILQRVRWWNPIFDYDLLFTPTDIYIGTSIAPFVITKPASEHIDATKLNEKAIERLKERGAIPYYDLDTGELTYIEYRRTPPFKNIAKEFEKTLYKRLFEKYIEVERA